MVECCRDGCPSIRFSHLNRGTLELCQIDHRVLGHLPDQGPSPSTAQFGRAASTRKSLGGSKLILIKNGGGHCVLGNLQCCRHLLVPFSRSVPRHNPISELYRQFLQPHGLVFALKCIVNCGTFSNHVQSVEFTTGGLQSSRNISRIINGNRMHLSPISSLIEKGLSTYVNKVYLFLIFSTFSKNLSLWGFVYRLMRKKM